MGKKKIVIGLLGIVVVLGVLFFVKNRDRGILYTVDLEPMTKVTSALSVRDVKVKKVRLKVSEDSIPVHVEEVYLNGDKLKREDFDVSDKEKVVTFKDAKVLKKNSKSSVVYKIGNSKVLKSDVLISNEVSGDHKYLDTKSHKYISESFNLEN